MALAECRGPRALASCHLGHMVRQASYEVMANVRRHRKGNCMALGSTMGLPKWFREWQITVTTDGAVLRGPFARKQLLLYPFCS